MIKKNTENESHSLNVLDTDIILIWRLVLGSFVTEIEYSQGKNNIVECVISRFPFNRNLETAQASACKH